MKKLRVEEVIVVEGKYDAGGFGGWAHSYDEWIFGL